MNTVKRMIRIYRMWLFLKIVEQNILNGRAEHAITVMNLLSVKHGFDGTATPALSLIGLSD